LLGEHQWNFTSGREALREQLKQSQRCTVRHGAKLLGVSPGDRGLDFGCGRGGSSIVLVTDYGASVLGIDCCASRIAAAERSAAKLGLAERLQFSNRSLFDHGPEASNFDFVWSCEVTGYVEALPELFQEWSRRLKPGGAALVFTYASSGADDEAARAVERKMREVYQVSPHSMDGYLGAIAGSPLRLEQESCLSAMALQYWQARRKAAQERGAESAIISGLESGCLHYMLWQLRKPERPATPENTAMPTRRSR